jgi:integrase
MTATPQTELRSRRQTLELSVERGEIAEDDFEAIEPFIEAYDPNNLMETPPAGETALAVGTCNIYMSRLTEAARHFSLVDATTGDVNAYLQEKQEGGAAEETINGYSTAFRTFYGRLDGDVDPGDIARVKRSNGSSFDPDDVLTREEIQAMLDAADNARDRAIFALLIYTGMRNNALRTLRVGDVDLHEGTWTFNEDMDGLKDAHTNGQTRPLLGAKGPVRDWLKFHPAPDDPDAYLITAKPKYRKGSDSPYQPVNGSTIRRALDRLAENTDDPELQEKPTHPHMMRHNFVTICKRDYELPDETVKFLIGHTEGSMVMQTTYSHLSDDDHIERAEVAAGIRKPSEEEGTFTPTACEICGQPLPPNAKACGSCGHVFAPDAKAAKEKVQQDMGAEKALAGLEDVEDLAEEEIQDMANDDELMALLVQARAERAD